MRLDHTISLFPRSQVAQDGLRVNPSKGAVTSVKASVQPLRPQEAYEAFGVDSVQGVKVFLLPDTVVPENAGFDFGAEQYIVQGKAEKHVYGRPNDHLKLYAVTAK